MGHSGSSLSSTCQRDDRLGAADIYARASRHQVLEEVCTPYDDINEVQQPQQVLLDIQRKELAEADIDPATVILHIYDVSATLSAANKVLAFASKDIALGGAFHTGLEAYGSEWSYGTEGVLSMPPRTADHVYRCSMVLGQTTLFKWVSELHEMCQTWKGQDYNMLGGINCNSFVVELCERIGVGPVPPWVDRFSRIARGGRNAGKVVANHAVKAANQARSHFSNRDRDKIAAQCNPQSHRVDDVEFKLPGTQIAVQGQKVVMENTKTKKDNNPRVQQDEPAPVYVKWNECDDEIWKDNSGGRLPRCNGWNEELTDMQSDRCADPDVTRQVLQTARGADTDIARQMMHLKPQPQLQRNGSPQLQRSGSIETMHPDDAYSHRKACMFTIGSSVEYFSSTQNNWIPANVLSFDSNLGLYDLSCKSQVPPHKIRTPQMPAGHDRHNFEQRSSKPRWFPPGQDVEYESASAEGCWIPTVVVGFYADTGLYDLDCKAQVPPEKIRPVEDFPIGAAVEYRSTSGGQNLGWIPGQILAFDEFTGLYDLTCKAKVSRARIQWPKHDR